MKYAKFTVITAVDRPSVERVLMVANARPVDRFVEADKPFAFNGDSIALTVVSDLMGREHYVTAPYEEVVKLLDAVDLSDTALEKLRAKKVLEDRERNLVYGPGRAEDEWPTRTRR